MTKSQAIFEEAQKYIACYEGGATIDEVAAQFGVTFGKVQRAIAKHGTPRGKGWRGAKPKPVEGSLALILDVRALADKCGGMDNLKELMEAMNE